MVLDCSIRDGGLINDHFFSDEMVREVYKGLSQSGIEYMEMGYRSSKELSPTADFGPWKYCDDDKVKQIIEGIESDLKLSIMVDAHRIKEQQFAPVDKSPISMIRAATYVKDTELAVDVIKKAHDLGYETTANIMAISTESEKDLISSLGKFSASPVDVVYIVDSFGGLYTEQTIKLVELFKEHLPGKAVGIHCHNNLQMAFGNTLTGIIHGVEYVDGSLSGIGRGCGNCCVELLIGYLDKPQYDLHPVLKVIGEQMMPLRQEIEWGYILPYMITGLLNEHPRSAIAMRKTADKDDYGAFYEELLKQKE